MTPTSIQIGDVDGELFDRGPLDGILGSSADLTEAALERFRVLVGTPEGLAAFASVDGARAALDDALARLSDVTGARCFSLLLFKPREGDDA